jgi:preprotein translocase subunit SecE
MKKPANKKKKKRSSRKRSQTADQAVAVASVEPSADGLAAQEEEKPQVLKKPVQPTPKREPEKKKEEKKSIGRFFTIAVQFLKEARAELKKVKWPTRKELLASTAMVIFLVIIAGAFLGLIDFGLIKFIKAVIR